MTTPTDDDPGLVTVIASMQAAEGRADELRDALTALVAPTLEEAGCVNYDLHESTEEPGHFFFYENWESDEHLDAHGESPHIQAFRAKAGDLLAGAPAVDRVSRIA